jgi:hypothetical protein
VAWWQDPGGAFFKKKSFANRKIKEGIVCLCDTGLCSLVFFVLGTKWREECISNIEEC